MDLGKENRRDNLQNLTPIEAGILNNLKTAFINSVIQDDKPLFLTHSRQLVVNSDDDDDDPSTNRKSVALMLLILCCNFDAIECATSLLNGEVETDFIPPVNEVDMSTKMTALQAAAKCHSARCLELLLKKRARTGAKSKDGQSLIALEMALSSSRMDVIWNPDDYSVEDLVVLLSEKDLTAVKLLSDKTKAIGEVAYSVAMEGKIVALAALLIVAAEKVNDYVVVLRDAYSGSKEKETVYQCVIREALSSSRRDTSPSGTAKVDSDMKRKVLLCEIELLQLFGADALHTCGDDKKLTLPLIRAIKARDEAVIELLLKTNMDVNEADSEGNSALHWSLRISWTSSSQQNKIIWLLLKHGAQVNQKDKLELTAFHIAAANGNAQALQVLLLEDPDGINYKTIMKETPLFFAVKNDHIECAELLKRWGANSEVLNIRRERPIDLAKSQDMRFTLKTTYITPMHRNSPVEQKYNPRFQGDEVIFDTCETLFTMADNEGSATESERNKTNLKTEICKYFESGGCVRGSKCFYAHGKEELQQAKQGIHFVHSPTEEKLKRKIFVGGIHPLLDSESLSKFFQDEFGSVEDAHIVGIKTGDEVLSRGFGFVTFKHEKSVSKAVQAHYVTIMGKQVEIKSAVGKWDESLKLALQRDSNDQCQPPLESPTTEKTAEEMPRKKSMEETKADQMSWVDKLLNGQPKRSSESQVQVSAIASNKKIPVWLRTFKKWFPGFLKEASRKPNVSQYPLSSLKADFRVAFGLELDHASLGYTKLSDFMRSFPDLCRMKVMPVGECGSPNHMVLIPSPPKPDWKSLQPLTMGRCPLSCVASPHEKTDTDSKNLKPPDLLFNSREDVSISSSQVDPSKNGLLGDLVVNAKSPVVQSDLLEFLKSDVCPYQTKLNDERNFQKGDLVVNTKSPVVQLDLLEFLNSDVCPYQTKLNDERNIQKANADDENGGPLSWVFNERKLGQTGRHLVLEALLRKQNNSSIFFLRQFDFYHNYKASIRQGKCFWCNQPKMLWANFPCQHLLWCGECKTEAARAAGDFDHQCVVCDANVQTFILPTLDRYPQSLHGRPLKTEEFRLFDSTRIQT